MEIHLTEPEDTIITLEEGSPGLSAYELALSKGFEGTLEEWLDSLKGGGDIPTPPSEGTYVLKVVDGVFSWVEDSSESVPPFGVEYFIYNGTDPADIYSYNTPSTPLNYPPSDDIYAIIFKLDNDTELRRVEVGIGGGWENLGAPYRANTQVAGAEENAWLFVIPYDFDAMAITELPITRDTQFKIVSMNNDEVVVTTQFNYVDPVADPVEPEGPFNVAITGHSTDGSFLPASEPISFPDGAMYIRFETDAVTPFDGLEIWDFNTGDWYVTNTNDSLMYDAVGPGKHILVWETANTIYKPFGFPETFILQYKFIKGNDEVVVEDTITFSSDTVELLPINLHNRSVDGMMSWQTLSTPVSLEDISSYSVWYYADYTITPDPGWPGTIEYAEYSESGLDWVTVPTESIQHYGESSWLFTPNVIYTKQTPTPNDQVQILYRFTSGGRVSVLTDIIDVVE